MLSTNLDLFCLGPYRASVRGEFAVVREGGKAWDQKIGVTRETTHLIDVLVVQQAAQLVGLAMRQPICRDGGFRESKGSDW